MTLEGVIVKSELENPLRFVVKIGKFGDIKRLMKQLSKRESFIDLHMVCANGVLGCHKFVIGAQSKYLRQLLLSAGTDGDPCCIYFPDVEKEHMEIILKFLYTGKLGITEGIKHIVRELLEDVLHVDAKVNLPESITPGAAGSRKDRDEGDDDGRGGAGGSPHAPPPPPPPGPPPKKKFKPANDAAGSEGSAGNNSSPGGENKSELMKSLGLIDNMARPPTPPQEVEYCNYDGEVEVVEKPPKTPPPVVCLEDSDDDDDAEKSKRPENWHRNASDTIARAPQVVAKKTGYNPGPIDFPGHASDAIARAPQIVAKKTGYNSGPIDFTGQRSRPDISEHLRVEFGMPPETTFVRSGSECHADGGQGSASPPSPRACWLEAAVDQEGRRKTRTSTGAIQRTNLNEDFPDLDDGAYDAGGFNIQIENPENSDDDTEYLPAEMLPPLHLALPLPPPIPVPPEAGMVINRGRWVRQTPKAKRSAEGKVLKYAFSPYTITGKTLEATFANLVEPEGRNPCDECPNVYAKRASLIKHKGRIHNPRLTVKCPECPKMLSHVSAVAKHLLSHRPEEQWPYRCEFCGKHFQAKGDLPKHWFTSKHRNDPAIPQPGSPDWFEVLKRSQKFNLREVVRQLKPFPSSSEAEGATGAEGNVSDDEDDDLIIEPTNLEEIVAQEEEAREGRDQGGAETDAPAEVVGPQVEPESQTPKQSENANEEVRGTSSAPEDAVKTVAMDESNTEVELVFSSFGPSSLPDVDDEVGGSPKPTATAPL